MKAMLLERTGKMRPDSDPLVLREVPAPQPAEGEILVRVLCCGVCHTELDEIEGRMPPEHLPVIPGHQVVGLVEKNGPGSRKHTVGQRVGVAWIYSACGECDFCRAGEENLCRDFRATGRDAHGGYAEFMVVPESFAYPIPATYKDEEVAPLLCAGAIGYRSLRLADHRNGQKLGLTGFGGSGHLVLKMVRARYPESRVYVFARNPEERRFALEIGAHWAGDTEDYPPELLDAIIDTTPVWKPVVEALKRLRPGGRLVVNAIRKEEGDKDYLTRLSYPEDLWMEKEVKSVANVTRKDVLDFLEIAASIPIMPEYQVFPLAEANRALRELRFEKIRGAKVLVIDSKQ